MRSRDGEQDWHDIRISNLLEDEDEDPRMGSRASGRMSGGWKKKWTDARGREELDKRQRGVSTFIFRHIYPVNRHVTTTTAIFHHDATCSIRSRTDHEYHWEGRETK